MERTIYLLSQRKVKYLTNKMKKAIAEWKSIKDKHVFLQTKKGQKFTLHVEGFLSEAGDAGADLGLYGVECTRAFKKLSSIRWNTSYYNLYDERCENEVDKFFKSLSEEELQAHFKNIDDMITKINHRTKEKETGELIH